LCQSSGWGIYYSDVYSIHSNTNLYVHNILVLPIVRMETGSLEHVALERGIPDAVVTDLRNMGHNITADVHGWNRALMGRGQVIARGPWGFMPPQVRERGDVYWAGTDPRADGAALGY